MGLSIEEALANMLDRCDTPAMRSFVRSVLQGETLGVSIGQIMRDLATRCASAGGRRPRSGRRRRRSRSCSRSSS